MSESGICRNCGAGNVAMAEFCSQCGQPLGHSHATVGRVRHPSPCATPQNFSRVAPSADLYYQVSSAWGGRRLLATENLGLTLFNAGYGLKEVELCIEGYDKQGGRCFVIARQLPSLPRKGRVSIEIPSYDIPEPPESVGVKLVAAKYA